MSPPGQRYQVRRDDFFYLLARGFIPGASPLHKFGQNPDIDTGTVPEDVWDVGGIWVPPTTARVHDLVSTSVNDAAAGTGARTVELTGLTSWSQPPETEVVTLNGTTPVTTLKAWVVIYRMETLTFGSTQSNAGDVTATADVDATVTAQISAGKGQTLMAIFAVPSVQELQLTGYYMGWVQKGAAAANSADLDLLVNLRPDQADGGFVTKHHLGLYGAGTTYIPHKFRPYRVIPGPAIVKVQVTDVSASNTSITSGFDGIVVEV